MSPAETESPGKAKLKSSSIRIVPYTDSWCGAVADFNRRVRPGSPPFELPETPKPEWIPRTRGSRIYQEMFLAVEGEALRGAYTFKHQEIFIDGSLTEIGMCVMPISEGIVNKRYSFIAPALISHATRRQPLLYGLGFGNLEAPVTQILFAMGWKFNRAVPFYFKVRDGNRFLRNIRHLRTTGLRRWLFDAAARLGVGWAAATAAKALIPARHDGSVSVEETPGFYPWADEIWRNCQKRYSVIAARDSGVLETLYPSDNQRFIRLKVMVGQRLAGWAVVLDTEMRDHKHFGNMRVGSIIDCLATPEDAGYVIRASAAYLEERGVDVLISNQSHPAWCGALGSAGFVSGPTNFYLITSRKLTSLLSGTDPAGFHLNRGDGEGPIHL